MFLVEEPLPKAKPAIRTLLARLVPRDRPGDFAQALMDLGATVCRPAPRCDRCPVTRSCAWNRADRPEPDPSVGSAGVSTPQSRFEGSERQARGRVLKALTAGPAPSHAFAGHLVDGLVAERLVVRAGDLLRLP